MVAPENGFYFKAYVVHLDERNEWKGGSHELLKQGIIWFTDGSKNEKGVGQEHGEGDRMQSEIVRNVFQAEVIAIAECARCP